MLSETNLKTELIAEFYKYYYLEGDNRIAYTVDEKSIRLGEIISEYMSEAVVGVTGITTNFSNVEITIPEWPEVDVSLTFISNPLAEISGSRGISDEDLLAEATTLVPTAVGFITYTPVGPIIPFITPTWGSSNAELIAQTVEIFCEDLATSIHNYVKQIKFQMTGTSASGVVLTVVWTIT